jgi:rubrerythrin
MVDNVILNISNMTAKKNIEIRSNDLSNKNQKGKNTNFSKSIKQKDFNFLSTEENELFKNNNKMNKIQNESIYPVKIKKMSKTDIIIGEEDPKKTNFILQNISTDITDLGNKKIKSKFKNKRTNKDGKEIYICDICNKKYNIKNSFRKHLLTHQKKQFICIKCNSRFSVNSKLKRHLLIHNDIKEFKCPICNLAFNLKYNLKVHMRIHTNEKPYICGYPGCFAKFAQQNNLTTHCKIHTNNSDKDEKEKNILLNFHNSIMKFNNKSFNAKLIELNKIALNG